MPIQKEKFNHFITHYTKDEQFYQKLYELEQTSSSELTNFINQLDLPYIKSRRLYVPQLHLKWVDYMDENALFGNVDICVQKHYRYTPTFIHEHEFYEILYVYQGQCQNTIENVKDLTCIEGDILIIPPKTKHSVGVFDGSIIINILIKSNTFHMTFFDLFTSQNVVSQFFSHSLYSQTENNYLLFRTEHDKQIQSLIEDIYIEANNKQKYYENLLKSYLMTFWGLLLRHHEHNIQIFLNTDKNYLKVIDILNYLQDNYQTITLQEAADHFGFSTPHFSKIIKDSTGQTFIQIIKNIKLDKACELLKDSNLTIATICEIVGYSNPEHFTRTFKKVYDTSPGEYRKNNQIDSK